MPQRRVKSIRRAYAQLAAALVVAGIAIGVSTAPAYANPTSPLFTGSATCANGTLQLSAPTVTSPLSDVVAEIQASNDASGVFREDDNGDPDLAIGANDTSWVDTGSVPVGNNPGVYIDACSSGSFDVSLFIAANAPTSYSGATTYDGDVPGSELPFSVPSTNLYEAVVNVNQGAVELDNYDSYDNITSPVCSNGTSVFTSGGVCDLGTETVGRPGTIDVTALDGPQAHWTITIEPIPVALSSVSASPTSAFTGTPVKISYTVSGSTSVTAGVYNSANQDVDTLASALSVSQGNHSLTWGGTGQNGTPLPAGNYTIKLSSTDSQGNVSTQSVPFRITPVTVSGVLASKTTLDTGVEDTISYKTSGSAKVTIAAYRGSKLAQTLVSAASVVKGAHSLKWNGTNGRGRPVATGTYRIKIRAVDSGGDVSTGAASIHVIAAPAKVYVPTSDNAQPGGRFMSIEPTTLSYTGDGSGILKRLKWSSWTNTGGSAAAIDAYDTCANSCAGGPIINYPVRVRVSGQAREHGVQVFTRMTFTYTRRKPSASPRTMRFSMSYADGGFNWNFLTTLHR